MLFLMRRVEELVSDLLCDEGSGADDQGVPARSKSVGMFRTEGFVDVASRESQMAKYGGVNGDFTWYLVHNPPS